jgi:hypothetical protein
MCVEALDKSNKILMCSQLAAEGRSAIFQRPSHSWLSGEDVMGSHHMDWSCENDEVLYKVKEERSILHAVKRRKANWIGHILHTNCLLKHIFEGKIEGMRRWGRGGEGEGGGEEGGGEEEGEEEELDNIMEKRRY